MSVVKPELPCKNITWAAFAAMEESCSLVILKLKHTRPELCVDNNARHCGRFAPKDKRLVPVKMVLQMCAQWDRQACVCVYMDKDLIVYLLQK